MRFPPVSFLNGNQNTGNIQDCDRMYQAESKGSLLGTNKQLVLASMDWKKIGFKFFPHLVQTGIWSRLPHCGFRSQLLTHLGNWIFVSFFAFRNVQGLFFLLCTTKERGLKIFFSINISTKMFSSQFWWKHIFYILMLKWSFFNDNCNCYCCCLLFLKSGSIR